MNLGTKPLNMSISEIKTGQKWRLINLVNRPDVIIQGVNLYNFTVRWSYENENRSNESEYEYFTKNFKKVED